MPSGWLPSLAPSKQKIFMPLPRLWQPRYWVKPTKISRFYWNLLRVRKPFIVLDWRRNYRHFLNRPEGKDILVFSLGEEKSLSFNPLEPPPNLSQSQREAYLRDIISIICTTYLPGHHLLSTRGVEFFFLTSLDVLSTQREKPITFNDIGHCIKGYNARSREIDWKVSALNVLYRLTTGPVGRLVNSEGVVTVKDILDRPVILELDGLGSESDRALFTQALMLWLYYYRMAEGRSKLFKHVLFVEEAHNLFLRAGGKQSVHDLMLRQMRDLGEALVLFDQNPSLLSTPSLGNTGVTICLNLKHGEDVEAAGRALTLPRENWDYLGRLPVGYAIVKVQDRWDRPFLVHFPRFPVSNHLNPSQAKKGHIRGYSVQRLTQELQSALNEAVRALREGDRRKKEKSRISAEGQSLLADIARYPLCVVTKRYRRLGWSAYKGNRIKRELLEKRFIDQEKIRTPNGSVTVLKLTAQGKTFLNLSGIEVKALPKNASLEHEYWKKIMAEHYRKRGYEVEEEVPVGEGKAVDLVATKDNERIAIEIETGKSDAESNLEKCRKAGFEKVVIIDTRRVLDHLIS
jgi:hypothetical protein